MQVVLPPSTSPSPPTVYSLGSSQHLASVAKDYHAKKDVVYLMMCRNHDYLVMTQSLPLLAKWVNDNLSCGEQWDRVTVTGLHNCLNCTDGRNGGWHKGRFRVRTLPLATSRDEFEAAREGFSKAVIVAGMPRRYHTFEAQR